MRFSTSTPWPTAPTTASTPWPTGWGGAGSPRDEIEPRHLRGFRDPAWPGSSNDAVIAGVDAGVDAVVDWVIDVAEPAAGAAYAREHGVPVIALERPRFPVDASVVYPNFNHGVYMAEYLATLLAPGARSVSSADRRWSTTSS